MGKNNGGPKKSWFDLQSEKKGKNFLDFWANGADPEFKYDDNKIRAVDSILRDIRNRSLTYDKDLTPERLCNPELLQSIINILSNRLRFESTLMNGFGILCDIDEAHFKRDSLKYTYDTITDETKKANFFNNLKEGDKALLLSNYEPYDYIPDYKSLIGTMHNNPYINGIRVCLLMRIKMYNHLINDFNILKNSFNAPPPIGILSSIAETLDSLSREGPRSSDNKRIPATLDLLSGQIWTR